MGSNIKLNKWKCRHCNNVFDTKMSLYEHMHIMHPEKCFKTKNKEWTCQYCNQIFHSRQKLYNHYKDCVEKAKLPKDSLGKTINIDGKREGFCGSTCAGEDWRALPPTGIYASTAYKAPEANHEYGSCRNDALMELINTTYKYMGSEIDRETLE